MIERYTRPEMGSIWTSQARYEAWYKVELAAMQAMAEHRVVPAEAYEAVRAAKVTIDPARIDAIEAVTKHDVIAFLTHLEEQIGEPARWIHFGLTSSDVLDTALALQLSDASRRIEADLDDFIRAASDLARTHKDTVMIGRTHGIHAEPVTFGLVALVWVAEFERHRERFRAAAQEVRIGMFSGAVGTFANLPVEVEERACELLGLRPEPVSNQVIQRDRHAEYFLTLAGIASSFEKVAVQLRHLQRTEVREVEEAFSKGQKGSSAMPHKRNPIGGENLSGLARLVRSYAVAALENVPLWHERDISHSSVERVIAPDATILTDYALARLTRILRNLNVYPDRMRENLNLMRGLVFTQSFLLELIRRGVPRQAAYELVQRNAMKVWQDPSLTLERALLDDPDMAACLDPSEVRARLDPLALVAQRDRIFARVLPPKS